MQAPGPTLETQRLILRPTHRGDFDRWAQVMADEESARFIGGVQTRSMAWRGMMSMAGAWALTGVAMFSVIEKASARWVGRVGPWQPEGWPGTEVGWGLHPDSWGQGYGVEAARAAMDYAADVLKWTDIIHVIDPENTASKRLAQRLGSALLRMTRMPAPFDDSGEVECWGQSARQWQQRQRRQS